MLEGNQLTVKGLSPRVRGNPSTISTATTSGGSIPACAGEPSIEERRANRGRVYPRVCGGTQAETWTNVLLEGLSPRVRGNLSFVDAPIQ